MAFLSWSRKFRWSEKFNFESYDATNLPPLASFKDGIPRCYFGYTRSMEWLCQYSLDHEIVTKEKAKQIGAMDEALWYIKDQTKQDYEVWTPDDKPHAIFYVSSNISRRLLKEVSPEDIKRLRDILGDVSDDEQPRWITTVMAFISWSRKFRWSEGFDLQSYDATNLPPLASFKDGIPECYFGYIRSPDWLREYALNHGLATKDDAQRLDTMDISACHIQLQIGQDWTVWTPKADGLIFHVSSNTCEIELKEASSEDIKRLRDILGDVPDDEPPRWISSRERKSKRKATKPQHQPSSA
ncbi:hypothetical protein C8Q75DRAFT_803587 [Abortiporus biennis]|nr:hypothetical protein C8Q75DRAFT_803587 [Abortiporus biennis]